MLQGRLAAFPTGPDSTHAQGNPLLQFWCRNMMSICWAYKKIPAKRKLLAANYLIDVITVENLQLSLGMMGLPWPKVQLLQHQAHCHIVRNVYQIANFLSSGYA